MADGVREEACARFSLIIMARERDKGDDLGGGYDIRMVGRVFMVVVRRVLISMVERVLMVIGVRVFMAMVWWRLWWW